MSNKQLQKAVKHLSIASVQLASAIENLSAIARDMNDADQRCGTELKVVPLSVEEFTQLVAKDAVQTGRVAETEDVKPETQSIHIAGLDLGAVLAGKAVDTSEVKVTKAVDKTEQVAEKQEDAVAEKQEDAVAEKQEDAVAEKQEDAVAEKQEDAVAEHAMYFSHDGSDAVFMVKKGESLAFLNDGEVTEITKSQYHRAKKQNEAAEAEAKLAMDVNKDTQGTEDTQGDEAELKDDFSDESEDETVAETKTETGDDTEANNNAMFKLITKTLQQACTDTLTDRMTIKKKLAKFDGATSISGLTFDQKVELWESWVSSFATDTQLPF